MLQDVGLDLKQVGRVHLDDVFQGLVCFFADDLISGLGVELREDLEELLGRWRDASHPQGLVDLAKHVNEDQLLMVWGFHVGDHLDRRLEEFRLQLLAVAPVRVKVLEQLGESFHEAESTAIPRQGEHEFNHVRLNLNEVTLNVQVMSQGLKKALTISNFLSVWSIKWTYSRLRAKDNFTLCYNRRRVRRRIDAVTYWVFLILLNCREHSF